MHLRGISCLGLCHRKYPVKKLIKAFEGVDVMCFGWLDNFFNPKSSKHAIKMMMENKLKVVRVHIINGPGLNNGRVQKHEITYGMTHAKVVSAIKSGDKKFLNKFRKRCRHIAEIVSYSPAGTLEKLYISPWLERQPVPAKVMSTLATIVREEFGAQPVTIVDNPVSGGNYHDYIEERHGVKPAIGIVDLDGLDYREAPMPKFEANASVAQVAYIWAFDDNGLELGGGWLPPERRQHFSHKSKWATYKRWVEEGEALFPRE